MNPVYPLRLPKAQAPRPDAKDFLRSPGAYGKTLYNPQGRHLGQDLSCPKNVIVQAVYASTITWKGCYADLGNVLRMQDPWGREWWHCHLDRFGGIEVGQRVRAGYGVARVGATGNASGPHDHIVLLPEPLRGRKWGSIPYLDPFAELYEAWRVLA